MPGASVHTIRTTRKNIGMGIVHVNLYDTEDRTNRDYLEDTHKNSCDCCCCYSYSPNPDDVNAGKEAELAKNFPQFEAQIHQLLEARRERAKEYAPGKRRCTIL